MADPIRIFWLPGSPAAGSLLPTLETYGYNDSFDRDNTTNTLGRTPDGKAWKPLRGTWGINYGSAIVTAMGGGGIQIAVAESYSADGVFEMNYARRAGGDTGGGAVLRAVDVNNHLFLNSSGGNGLIRLWKRINGTAEAIGTATTGPFPDLETIRVVLDGSSIKVYVAGSLIIDAIDGTFANATMHGIAINHLDTRIMDARFLYQPKA